MTGSWCCPSSGVHTWGRQGKNHDCLSILRLQGQGQQPCLDMCALSPCFQPLQCHTCTARSGALRSPPPSPHAARHRPRRCHPEVGSASKGARGLTRLCFSQSRHIVGGHGHTVRALCPARSLPDPRLGQASGLHHQSWHRTCVPMTHSLSSLEKWHEVMASWVVWNLSAGAALLPTADHTMARLRSTFVVVCMQVS